MTQIGERSGGRRQGRPEELLSAEEVAEMIGMTSEYVYDLSRHGRIPTIIFAAR
jgi:predicted DNA-binding transcriptional regulator AlpA